MAKKKDKPQVINNIEEINLEIDYDKLAEAIVIAQEKTNKKIYIKTDTEPSYTSTLDFGLLSTAGNIFNFAFNPALTLDCSPSLEIKVADQIGLINGKIG